MVALTDSSEVHPKSSYTATADATTGAWEIAMDPFVPSGTDSNNFTLTLSGSKVGSPIVAENVAYGGTTFLFSNTYLL